MKVTVEVPEPVVTPPPTVTLELSLEEAAVVKAAVGSFTNNSTDPFGAVCTEAWNALENAGVDPNDKVYFFYELKGEINSNEDRPLPEVQFSGRH